MSITRISTSPRTAVLSFCFWFLREEFHPATGEEAEAEEFSSSVDRNISFPGTLIGFRTLRKAVGRETSHLSLWAQLE
jgi:hypothetical protein